MFAVSIMPSYHAAVSVITCRWLASVKFVCVSVVAACMYFQVIPLEFFEGQSSDGQFVPIVAGGSSVPLTFSNRRAYVDCAIQFRLHEMDLQVGCLL